jgi:hypothetical protein
MLAQLANDTAELVRAKPYIDCHGEVVEPKFRFLAPGADVDVRRFAAFVRVSPVGTPAQDRRHFFTSRVD